MGCEQYLPGAGSRPRRYHGAVASNCTTALDTSPFSLPPPVPGLAAALAVGLLIGLQRGWRSRDMSEGSRVAGLRTFALVGLFGGVLGSLYESFGVWPLAGGLVGLAVLMAVAYREGVAASGDLSATSSVAALLTFSLGALAASGDAGPAVGAAVVTAVLLDLKPTLHRWLRMTEHRELSAALQLLVLSLVILPLLPDSGFGPHQALNPYRLWWAVVLVAGLSLAGHFAMRFSGPARGMLWTGLLGGLASSTAATLALARQARDKPALVDAAAAGTLAACGVMFLRMTTILTALQPAFGRAIAAPLLASGAVLLALAALQWRRRDATAQAGSAEDMAPFGLGTALGFGAFLGVMALLVQVSKAWFGIAGVYGLAALSGLADVDVIVVSLARVQGTDGLPATAVLLALGLAALANMVTKATIAWITGGAALGKKVVAAYAIAAVAGGSVAAASMLV